MFSAPPKKRHVFPQQVWSNVKPNFLAQAQLPQGAVLVSCAAGARRVARGAWRVARGACVELMKPAAGPPEKMAAVRSPRSDSRAYEYLQMVEEGPKRG